MRTGLYRNFTRATGIVSTHRQVRLTGPKKVEIFSRITVAGFKIDEIL